MHLPNASQAVVKQRKVTDYLLAFEHPEGGGKAEFFTHFGFAAELWETLADALRAHALAHPVSSISDSPYGIKHRLDGPLLCPDGRIPSVRAVWIIDRGSTAPRLVTAHPSSI